MVAPAPYCPFSFKWAQKIKEVGKGRSNTVHLANLTLTFIVNTYNILAMNGQGENWFQFSYKDFRNYFSNASDRAIKKALELLKEAGFIDVEVRRQAGRRVFVKLNLEALEVKPSRKEERTEARDNVVEFKRRSLRQRRNRHRRNGFLRRVSEGAGSNGLQSRAVKAVCAVDGCKEGGEAVSCSGERRGGDLHSAGFGEGRNAKENTAVQEASERDDGRDIGGHDKKEAAIYLTDKERLTLLQEFGYYFEAEKIMLDDFIEEVGLWAKSRGMAVKNGFKLLWTILVKNRGVIPLSEKKRISAVEKKIKEELYALDRSEHLFFYLAVPHPVRREEAQQKYTDVMLKYIKDMSIVRLVDKEIKKEIVHRFTKGVWANRDGKEIFLANLKKFDVFERIARVVNG